jgi:hypothetical protein
MAAGGDAVTTETHDTMMELLGKYGFPTLVAVALGFFIRQDLLLPLLEEHRLTLKEVRETQREIADAVGEQTRLLYAIQRNVNEEVWTVDVKETPAGDN